MPLTLAAITVLMFRRVPFNNENIYLLAIRNWWHPDPANWTYAVRWNEHFLFNATLGALAQVVPLTAIAWAGRLVSWTFVLFGLFRIGRRLEVSPPLISLSILLWIGIGQQLVGFEWIFQSFEAKVPAYACLFFALDAFIGGRMRATGVLLGCCFTLHPGVGFAAFWGFGLVLIALRPPKRAWLEVIVPSALCGLPGIVSALLVSRAATASDPLAWRFVTFQALPRHFNVLDFSQQSLASIALLLVFVWRATRREPEQRALRVVFSLLAGLSLLFTLGVAAFALGKFHWLQVFPFRVFPLLLPLLGLFVVARTLTVAPRRPGEFVMPGLALLTVISLGNPFPNLREEFGMSVSSWHATDDLDAAMRWTRENAPPDAVVALPPDRKDGDWVTDRATVVSWWAVPYDRLPAWIARLEDLLGPIDRGAVRVPARGELLDRFNRRPQPELETALRRDRATLLISTARYTFPVLHEEGSWRVYDVRGAGKDK
jgi:hypothetical protein